MDVCFLDSLLNFLHAMTINKYGPNNFTMTGACPCGTVLMSIVHGVPERLDYLEVCGFTSHAWLTDSLYQDHIVHML